MKKAVILLIFTACNLLLANFPVLADDNFSVSLDVIYKVNDKGLTTVTQNFQLTNLSLSYFPAEYVAKLGYQDIQNLRVFDTSGSLPITVSDQEGDKEIRVRFGDQVTGQNQILYWTVTYETSQVAKKTGRLWEIFLPKPASSDHLQNYTLSLYVPPFFGRPVYFKPKPDSQPAGYLWTKDLSSFGVFAVFDPRNLSAPYQSYNFTLKYNLYNPKLYPVFMDLALPPDTAYQKIFLNQLSPRPTQVSLDLDGNWLAKYQLGPAGRLEVRASGSAAVFFQPKLKTLANNSDLDFYLRPQKYWEVDDPAVASLAKNLATPEKIFQFVTATLTYNPGRLKENAERIGAKTALSQKGLATCWEFADLFIALSRSAGIPARALSGYLTQAKDSLHCWPQYYDRQNATWMSVDPAWAKATGGTDNFHFLDFDHLTFAVSGSATNPLTSSDFSVTPVDTDLEINQPPKIGLRLDVPKQITGGFSSQAQIFVENYGPTAFAGDTAILESQSLAINEPRKDTGVILPFTSKTLSFPIGVSDWREDKNDIIALQFADQQRTFVVSVRPFFRNRFILTVGALLTLGVISLVAQIARSLLVSKFSGQDNLHR